MTRHFIAAGAALGFLGVAVGAFGAHALADHFAANPDLEPTFLTAARYQMYHALALFGAGWAWAQWEHRWVLWAGRLFLLGTVLFSGSLYVLALGGPGFFGAIAPLGGAAFLAGWALLGLGVWRAAAPAA